MTHSGPNRPASSEQMAAFTEAVICKIHPELSGSLIVEFDRRPGFVFEVHRAGQRVRLTFTLTPKHPKWKGYVHQAAHACWEVRFTSTHARSLRMDDIPGHAISRWIDRPQTWHIGSRDEAEFFASLYGNGRKS